MSSYSKTALFSSQKHFDSYSVTGSQICEKYVGKSYLHSKNEETSPERPYVFRVTVSKWRGLMSRANALAIEHYQGHRYNWDKEGHPSCPQIQKPGSFSLLRATPFTSSLGAIVQCHEPSHHTATCLANGLGQSPWLLSHTPLCPSVEEWEPGCVPGMVPEHLLYSVQLQEGDSPGVL